MATQNYSASVQGVSIRVTKLDDRGNLLTGPMDSYTTSKFIRVSFTPEYEAGEEITSKAADGTVCVSYMAPDTLKRVNMEIAICEPDPELSNLMSGGLLLEHNNSSVGWASAQVGEEPTPNGVAVEVWSRAIVNGRSASTQPYFHWVFPFVKTRLSGDRVIENGLMATTFEGFGLGNINFRSGIDGSWLWPAAVDRPYLYARSDYAPTGMDGFVTWTQGPVDPNTGLLRPLGSQVGTLPSGATGTNVPKAQAPYPYTNSRSVDPILSTKDAIVDPAQIPAGIPEYPTPARYTDVKNTSPTGSSAPSVGYKSRGDDPTRADKGAASPNAIFNGTAAFMGPVPAAFGSVSSPSGGDGSTAAAGLLSGLGYVAQPNTKWTTGQYITVENHKYYWDGSAWQPGVAK